MRLAMGSSDGTECKSVDAGAAGRLCCERRHQDDKAFTCPDFITTPACLGLSSTEQVQVAKEKISNR